jgi:hypothetical protein
LEVATHLPRVPTLVLFLDVKLLKKTHKVTAMVAIVKHLSPPWCGTAGCPCR